MSQNQFSSKQDLESDTKLQMSDQQSFINKKVLFDLKECEHLFQKDKSENFLLLNLQFKNLCRQKKDIEGIQQEIQQLKQIENDYYADLLIYDDLKESIFGLKPETPYKKKYIPKIIGQDPVDGNQVMTREEFKTKYGRYPQ